MSKGAEIVDLDKVLLQTILDPSKKIHNYKTKRLTAPGENYGSLMLAAEITLEDTKTEKHEYINAVAKMVPDNEFIQKVFQTPITFKKELELYRTIVPTLQQFQRDQGMKEVIEFFPTFYGGRMGLTDEDKYDTNAVILLENLKAKGYQNVNRFLGFDLETSKLILRDLAKLHAVPIALKLKKPEVFEKKVKPYLQPLIMGSGSDEMMNAMREELLKVAMEDPFCENHLTAIKNALKHVEEKMKEPNKPSEPFATLIHCDFWVNNTLIKFESNKPIDNKMVDFQIIDYNSPAKDLIFFIFISVQNKVIQCRYEELLLEYHQTFVETLEKLGVDTAPFTFKALEDEIEVTVRNFSLSQCTFMLKPIFASEKDGKNVEDISENDFIEKREVTPEYKKKLHLILREFIKRKWI